MTLRSISVCGGILVLALVAAWIISTLPNPPAGPDQRAWHPGEERTETSQTPVDVGAPLEQDGVTLERRVLDVQKHANRTLSARFRGRRIDFRALSALRVTDNVYLAQRKGWTVSEGGLVRLTPWGLLGGDAILIDAPGAAFALIEDLTELPEVLDLREGAEVLCVVVSEDGQTPHADMVVRLKQWEMWIEGEGWLQEAVTDASGVARFTRVAPGRWSVDVVGHCATEFVQLAPDDRMARVTVAVPEGNTVLAGRVALEKHRFFGGCVVVEGGEWTGFRAMRAPVELDGSFEVPLPTRKTNSWRIGFATPWSGTILWSAMRYPSELFAEVHFPKQPATVRISVVDPSGRPVERYGVRAYARSGADDPRDRNIRHPGRDRVRFMGLHRDGRLEINDMVVGPQDHIMIQAVPADGDLARSRTVEIHARNEVDARITVPWAVPLTVRVTDREGTRIADAVVEVVAPPPKDPGWRWEMLPENDYLLPEELTEPAIVARGRTDATGTTRLALPQGGTYAVRARQDAWGVVADAGVHVPLTGSSKGSRTQIPCASLVRSMELAPF